MAPLPLNIMSNQGECNMDRLQAASSLLSLGSNCGLSPITIETPESDFNKAIASVIWSRHHRQPQSTVFQCGISNCPLCPGREDPNTRSIEQENTQNSDRATSKRSRQSSVVNWLISSLSSSSASTVPSDTSVGYGPLRSGTNAMTVSSSPASSQRSWHAPSSLTGSVCSNSDTVGSRSPSSSSSSPPYFTELSDIRRWSPTSSASSPDVSENSAKRQRLKDTSIIERHLPFSCKFCPKRFAQASNCLSHQRVHTGDRPFQCPYCPKSFAQRTSLRTHLRTHTGDRPYKCEDCQQRFGDLSTLTKHRRTHTGERPYRCQHEGCQRAFAQSGNLKRHYKTHLLDRKLQSIAS